MNRIEKIHAINEYRDDFLASITPANDESHDIRGALETRIKLLQPRISELIATANACFENTICIDWYGITQHPVSDCYLNGSFMARPNTKRIGFFKTWDNVTSWSDRRVSEIGFFRSGGTYGRVSFRTDGNEIYVADLRGPEFGKTEADIADMERFLADFDAFETAFYRYVDRTIEAKRADLEARGFVVKF